MTWFQFVILGLATWRCASLLVNEEGPFDVFLRMRTWAGITPDEDGKPLMVPERFFAKLLSCVWCSSIWVGTFWTVLSFVLPDVAPILAMPFALSASAILTNNILPK